MTHQNHATEGHSLKSHLEHSEYTTGRNPTVSVIMLALNAEQFLREAIQSVRNQRFEGWELVFVDDGSSDGTADIAEELAALEARIRVLRHQGGENRGTGPSRNLGLQASRGRYLAFLDADDVYEPDRLGRHVEVLEARPEVGTVISRECYWRRWAGKAEPNQLILPDYEIGPHGETETPLPEGRLLYSILATPGAPMPGICSITFRQGLLARTGLIPAKFVDQYEDQALIAKLLLQAPTYLVDACLARYRQHAGSLTHRARVSGAYRPGRPHQARDEYLTWLSAYLQTHGRWSGAWASVLARKQKPATAFHGGDETGGQLRRLARAVACRLPSPLLDVMVRQLWTIRDRHVRNRALQAAHSMGGGRKWS